MKIRHSAWLILLLPCLVAAEDSAKTAPTSELRKVVPLPAPSPEASQAPAGPNRVREARPPVAKPSGSPSTPQQVDPSKTPQLRQVDPEVMRLNMPDLTLAWSYGQGPWSIDVGVRNVGTAPAPASTLYMDCSNSQQAVMDGDLYWPCDPLGPKGEKQWSWAIPALAPGQSHMVDFPLSSKNPEYTTWHVYADHDQVVSERDEQNNSEYKLH